jgi:hypothetical protein
MGLTVEALDPWVINGADVERSARWYQRALGMTREDFNPKQGENPRTALKFGRQKMNLRAVGASKADWFTAEHEKADSQDLSFLTRAQPEEIIANFRKCDIAIEMGPVARRGACGTLISVYGRNPDGNLIEIV